MKLRSLALPLAMLFAQLTFAASSPHQVEVCPSVSAVKAAGIQMVVPDSTWGWFGFNTNQYDTNEKWTFVLPLGGEPQNEQEALKKANASLSLLTQVDGPQHNTKDGEDVWVCGYAGNDNEFAIAVTPPFTQDFASMMSRYRH